MVCISIWYTVSGGLRRKISVNPIQKKRKKEMIKNLGQLVIFYIICEISL